MEFSIRPSGVRQHFVDRSNGVVGVREIDLDMIFRTRGPGTILRERMARAGDNAPAGAGKSLDSRVADSAARAR